MTAECNQTSFEFAAEGSRQVLAQFDGGTITSDAGGLLLRQTGQRISLLGRLAGCFTDGRDPKQIEHPLEQLLAVMAGCADVTGQQRKRARDRGKPLAGKSTLNRLEQSRKTPDRYRKINYQARAIDELWRNIFLESHPEAPEQIILDLDATSAGITCCVRDCGRGTST